MIQEESLGGLEMIGVLVLVIAIGAVVAFVGIVTMLFPQPVALPADDWCTTDAHPWLGTAILIAAAVVFAGYLGIHLSKISANRKNHNPVIEEPKFSLNELSHIDYLAEHEGTGCETCSRVRDKIVKIVEIREQSGAKK